MLKLVALKLVHWWLRVRQFLLSCWKTTKASFRATKKLADVRAESKRLRKLPIHLSFAVNEPDLRLDDLARLVAWSVSLGINRISFYDRAGVIKTRKDQLRTEILRERDRLMEQEAQQYPVQLVTAETIASSLEDDLSQLGGVLVCLLSGSDGRQSVVDAVRTLCSSRASRRSCLENFLVGDFGQKMSLGITEPELIVCFGAESCLNGYPPWIMRVSEIQYLHSHHDIHFDLFMTPIQAYANCEQRLGK